MLNVDQRLDELYAEMIGWRRHLHMHPELSFQERQTSAFVCGLLQEWGIEISQNVGGFGIVGRITGGLPGPSVALRADMDALPIQDEKICEYRSTVPGVMHACGHDAHTSALLAAAKALNERRSELKGSIVLLFQPAEEVSPGGALPMIRQGALLGVDVIYGVHLWAPFPVGTAYCLSGPMMAAADEFTIEITGKGGHGGLPHETVDSIAVAAHVIVNLQSIVSRNIDPTEPCVISVGSIKAGGSFNVIAEKALMNGTVRTFNEETRRRIRQRMQEIIEQTCSMFGASAVFDYKDGYPPLVNDRHETERFFHAAPGIFGKDNVKPSPYIMAGEDFSYYLKKVPGCFMFVGAGNDTVQNPHHHPRFDIDERSMNLSSKLLTRMALNYMNEP